MHINDKDYEVIKLLGHGKGGYSYLVKDEQGLYVLKQIHHEPCSYYQFGDKLESELRDYERLLSSGISIPKLLEVDKTRERILKEYIDGPTIDYLILNNQMKEDYINQVQQMSSRLKDCNLNIDYFPTNFVVQEEKLYYIDFECNTYMEEWSFQQWGIKYWSLTEEFKAHFIK